LQGQAITWSAPATPVTNVFIAYPDFNQILYQSSQLPKHAQALSKKHPLPQTGHAMSKKNKRTSYRKNQSTTTNKTWFYANVGLAVLLIIAGVVALFWMGQQTVSSRTTEPDDTVAQTQGQTAPDFTLQALNGTPISLSDYSGQVILVNLWATWCPPCKAEMPAINAFYEEHKGNGFVVLAVNSQEDTATVQRFITEQGFSFPVVLDSRGEVANQYQVRGLPTTFIIGRDGQIQYTHSGAITYEQLEKIIIPLL